MAVSLPLTLAVVASALFAAGALIWLTVRTRAFPGKPVTGGWKGVGYAFGRGMLPREKESAGRHPLTLLAGALYHAGVFLAIFQLLAVILGFNVPHTLNSLLQILLLASIASGGSLFLKRAFTSTLRGLSYPDDYAANLVVDLFLLFSFLSAVDGTWVNWLLAAGTVFFLYMPVGKIRHCVFFFLTRVLFGRFFGARGVLPRQRPETPP